VMSKDTFLAHFCIFFPTMEKKHWVCKPITTRKNQRVCYGKKSKKKCVNSLQQKNWKESARAHCSKKKLVSLPWSKEKKFSTLWNILGWFMKRFYVVRKDLFQGLYAILRTAQGWERMISHELCLAKGTSLVDIHY
jgi:hypothetical protein